MPARHATRGPLHSQTMRKKAPEIDALKLGADWDAEDLGKPWVLVEASYG